MAKFGLIRNVTPEHFGGPKRAQLNCSIATIYFLNSQDGTEFARLVHSGNVLDPAKLSGRFKEKFPLSEVVSRSRAATTGPPSREGSLMPRSSSVPPRARTPEPDSDDEVTVARESNSQSTGVTLTLIPPFKHKSKLNFIKIYKNFISNYKLVFFPVLSPARKLSAVKQNHFLYRFFRLFSNFQNK